MTERQKKLHALRETMDKAFRRRDWWAAQQVMDEMKELEQG